MLGSWVNTELDKTIKGCYHIGLNANNDEVILTKEKVIIIDGDINKIEYDNDFIIVSQIPAKKIRREVREKGGNSDDEKRAIRQSEERQFWIIDLANDDRYIHIPKKTADSLRATVDVHGPLSKEKYDSLRNALGVPCELQFEKRQYLHGSSIDFSW